MTKLIEIEVPSRLNKNDIIIFADGKWVVQSKSEFLAGIHDELKKENDALIKRNIQLKSDIAKTNSRIDDINKDIMLLKTNVNKKLKEHHDVLNALTGGKA